MPESGWGQQESDWRLWRAPGSPGAPRTGGQRSQRQAPVRGRPPAAGSPPARTEALGARGAAGRSFVHKQDNTRAQAPSHRLPQDWQGLPGGL